MGLGILNLRIIDKLPIIHVPQLRSITATWIRNQVFLILFFTYDATLSLVSHSFIFPRLRRLLLLEIAERCRTVGYPIKCLLLLHKLGIKCKYSLLVPRRWLVLPLFWCYFLKKRVTILKWTLRSHRILLKCSKTCFILIFIYLRLSQLCLLCFWFLEVYPDILKRLICNLWGSSIAHFAVKLVVLFVSFQGGSRFYWLI